MQENRQVVYVAAALVLGVLALAALVIIWLGPTDPAGVAAVFVALAALLGAVPPIIQALRTGERDG